jgi:ATP-binding cassette subfamily B protein
MGEQAEHRLAVLRRLLREAGRYRRHLVGLAALDLLAAPLALLVPVPLKIAVDSVIGSTAAPGLVRALVPGRATGTSLLVAVAIMQVVVVALVQAQNMAAYALRTHVGEHLTLQFRSRMFGHAQRLSLAFHDERGVTDSVYRIQYDAPAIKWILAYALTQLGTGLATLAAMVYVTARLDWQLALVALAVCPPLVLLNQAYNRRMRPRYKEAHGVESSAMSVLSEVLSSLRVVSAFGREQDEHDRFVARSTRHARQQIRLSLHEGAFGFLVNVTTAAGTALVLYFGVLHVNDGRLTLGELMLVMAYLAQLYAPLATVSQQLATLQTSLAGAERAFELLGEVPDVRERPGARRLGRAYGWIELRGVSFSYDGRRPVLSDVSMRIAAGAKVGLAGRTGSGKTLVNLIARFYDPSEGAVLVDGVDARDIRLADLRRQFAMVLQEPVLFSATIAENIAYARPEASFAEIRAAAEAAEAHAFISALPDGYNTVVGERGMSLSGGERQRISIARAFLRDAPILVLDEPTSALDVATETSIVTAMRRLMAGRTTIMIAHRLSTLAVCDAVVELDGGRIAAVHEPPRPASPISA